MSVRTTCCMSAWPPQLTPKYRDCLDSANGLTFHPDISDSRKPLRILLVVSCSLRKAVQHVRKSSMTALAEPSYVCKGFRLTSGLIFWSQSQHIRRLHVQKSVESTCISRLQDDLVGGGGLVERGRQSR